MSTHYLGGTGYPLRPIIFNYAHEADHYYDSQHDNVQGTPFGGATNWFFLTDYIDSNTGTGDIITYQEAHNNSHGTPNYPSNDDPGDFRTDALYCSRHTDQTYGCYNAYANLDDQVWSVEVVKSLQTWGTDSSKLGQPAITTFNYQLAVALPGSTEKPPFYCNPAGSDTRCVGDDYDKVKGLQTGYHNLDLAVTSSSNGPTMQGQWSYSVNDTAPYYTVNKVKHSELDAGSGKNVTHIWQCQDITYDEGANTPTPVAGWPTTIKTYSDCSNQSNTAITSYLGYDAFGNVVATVDGLATAHSSWYGSQGMQNKNGCTLNTAPVFLSANWPAGAFTTCAVYDTPYEAQPTTVTNAFSQSSSSSYDYTQEALPTQVTDPNGQATTYAYSYDSNSGSNDKGIVSVSEPGECGPPCYTNQTNTFSSCVSGFPGGTTSPCYQTDSASSLYSEQFGSTFYDSQGRAVETTVPGPAPASPQSGMSYFTVTMTVYDDQQGSSWQSLPFVVAVKTNPSGPTGTGWLDPGTITDDTGASPGGTAVYNDALGRPIATQDPMINSQQEPGITCPNLPDMLTSLSTSGSPLVNETYSYDGNLRLTGASACWQSTGCNNNGGTIFSQSRGFDVASNVTSAVTQLAGVPGASSSGQETQVFCYDSQNRLVWAGNSGTVPSPGSGTCGTGTPGSTLSEGSYQSAYSYGHLDQLAQGPFNGSGSQQYLYCNTSALHQLTGIYATGATCSNKSGKGYGSTYDAWGNVVTRTLYNESQPNTATLSYDLLNHFIEWQDTDPNTGITTSQWNLYDASGERMLQHSTNNGTTTLTVYPLGKEEYHYTAGGTLQSSLHYDDLGGQLVDERSGSTTTMLLTDALGSVISSFSNTQNNAAVLGNQLYGPYGNQRLQAGTIDNSTSRGFTGQDNDTVTGLDYYGARYYDPAAGVFLSADSVEGNAVSMNPYGYVGGNPETMSDPTGQYVTTPGQEGNFVAQVSAYEIPSDFYDAFANDSLYATDPTITDETASTGNTTYTEDPTTDEITKTVDNANGSTTTSSLYPTDTGYQKAAGAFSNPASDGQLHPVNGGILEAQYGIRHKPGAGELGGGTTTSSQSGQGPTPQAGGNGQGNRPPTAKPTAPSPEGPGPGRMNPQKIRFTQNTCSNVTGKYTVEGNIQGLQNGTLSPEQMGDPIRVFQMESGMNGLTAKKSKFGPTSFANLADGEWYTLDNRRLYAFQEAGITDIPVQDVSGDIPFIISKSGRFTTTNYGTDIELRC